MSTNLVEFIETMRVFVVAQKECNDAVAAQAKALEARVRLLEGQVSTLSDHVHGLQAKRRVGRKPRA